MSKVIENKLENIRSHNATSKRGLINGLRTALKFVTGDIDNSGEKRINRIILNHMQQNQYNIQNQISMQYSINHEFIKDFNPTVQNIPHNQITLNESILEKENTVNINAEHQDIVFVEDMRNQLCLMSSKKKKIKTQYHIYYLQTIPVGIEYKLVTILPHI